MANCSRPGASLTLPSAMASVFPSPPPPLVATLTVILSPSRARFGPSHVRATWVRTTMDPRDGVKARPAPAGTRSWKSSIAAACAGREARRRALHDYASANLVRATAPATKAATKAAMRLILSPLFARSGAGASMA